MGLISGDCSLIKARKQSAGQACQELGLAQASPSSNLFVNKSCFTGGRQKVPA